MQQNKSFTFDVEIVRNKFPALQITDNNIPRIYLDNPGGTQICNSSIKYMKDYLIHNNANRGGSFVTSINTENILLEARQAMSDFINANSKDEIIFGANMTSLTFAIARSLTNWIKAGDEIILSRLDHDANISPWLQMAKDTGATVKWVDFDPTDCTLDIDSFNTAINDHTKLIAIGYASNSVGSINPIKTIAKMAHSVDALIFVDAVQYVPHGPTDVQDLDIDFLVCSAYKFFGPHQGILWGKYELLEKLKAYKVRPASEKPPDKFETGTQNHESQAGILGAISHFEWIGEKFGNKFSANFQHMSGRTLKLHNGLLAIQKYEQQLSHHLINGLQNIPNISIKGITNTKQISSRIPTISFTIKDQNPQQVAALLGDQNIFVWDGHYYAIEIIKQLGINSSKGMVRVGATHYNTINELDKFLDVLSSIK
ncbi:MAG TPA: cysteine desulfurase-like protein [Chloroflexi bacterium]|nr:cysteine desulfurase-like protein [Chloroflexota bacterium]|tara:strand:+ start:697 stop:1980 length:1284 start_codon:yes stop_codon:yes gene_type:complete